MNSFIFDLTSDEDIIIVNAIIESKYEFKLAFDTAATHTTIDSNVLYFSGYELKNPFSSIQSVSSVFLCICVLTILSGRRDTLFCFLVIKGVTGYSFVEASYSKDYILVFLCWHK